MSRAPFAGARPRAPISSSPRQDRSSRTTSDQEACCDNSVCRRPTCRELRPRRASADPVRSGLRDQRSARPSRSSRRLHRRAEPARQRLARRGTSLSTSAIRSARAPPTRHLARASQQRADEAQARQLELQVATEVTNAALLVETNRERLQAAQVAREFAESVSMPNRASSRSACRRTSSSCRRSAIFVTPRTPSCAPCSTIAARRWNSSACRTSPVGTPGLPTSNPPTPNGTACERGCWRQLWWRW